MKVLICLALSLLHLLAACSASKNSDQSGAFEFIEEKDITLLPADQKPKDASTCWVANEIKSFDLPAPTDNPRIDNLPARIRWFITALIPISQTKDGATTSNRGVACVYFLARSTDGGLSSHLDFFIELSRSEVAQLAQTLSTK